MPAPVKKVTIYDELESEARALDRIRVMQLTNEMDHWLSIGEITVKDSSAPGLVLHLKIHDTSAGFIFVEPRENGTWSVNNIRLQFELNFNRTPARLLGNYREAMINMLTAPGEGWVVADKGKVAAHDAIADFVGRRLKSKGVEFGNEVALKQAMKRLVSIWVENQTAQRGMGRTFRSTDECGL